MLDSSRQLSVQESLRPSVQESFMAAIDAAPHFTDPFPYWIISDVLPVKVCRDLCALPFSSFDVGDLGGARENHNDKRIFFSRENQERHPVMGEVAHALQQADLVESVERVFNTKVRGGNLRIELALDRNGFWMRPHTDIGVKIFTMLLYISDHAEHENLGTDVYADPETPVRRIPFRMNSALAFIPSDRTWHGFEPRPIRGTRKSVIINYVTDEWIDREQLCFPDQPV